MSLTSFVGNRLSFKPQTRRHSPGVVIAVTGIAVSFIVMTLAISIVIGFKNEIVHKLTGFNAQITILPPATSSDGSVPQPIHYDESIEEIIRRIIPEAEISNAINQPAVFKTDSAFQGIVLHGMDSDGAWDFVEQNLTHGNMIDQSKPDGSQLIISSATANALCLKPGDKLLTHFFDGNSLRSRKLTVSGIYDSHFKDFDNTIAFVPISLLRDVFDVDSTTSTAIEIRGINNSDIDRLSENLYQAFLNNMLDSGNAVNPAQSLYRIENLNTQCALYINWLNLLDTNVAVIIALMACVSAFTLISSLFIIILERVNMIGLFKAMGATNSQIRKIFIYMAQRLVLRGLVIGNLIGIGIILIQQKFHLFPLDPDAYYLNFVPMQLSWPAIITLNINVIVLSAIILILPSYLISSMSPAKSIKYE